MSVIFAINQYSINSNGIANRLANSTLPEFVAPDSRTKQQNCSKPYTLLEIFHYVVNLIYNKLISDNYIRLSM